MTPLFILLFMVFLHIFDDYYLQGCLANMKQQSWWEKNAPDDMYKKDYVMALICHAMSWSFMIILPIAIATHWFTEGKTIYLLLIYPFNVIIHSITDDLKANKKKINLITDQCIHFAQILLTFIYYSLFIIFK